MRVRGVERQAFTCEFEGSCGVAARHEPFGERFVENWIIFPQRNKSSPAEVVQQLQNIRGRL